MRKRIRLLLMAMLFGVSVVALNAINDSYATNYTWSAHTVLSGAVTGSPSGFSRVHNSAMSSDGTHRVAVWSGPTFAASVSHDNGQTWSQPVNINDGTLGVEDPQVTMSDDGLTTTALWRSRSASGEYRMATSTSVDGGATWSATQFLSAERTTPQRFDLSGSADGTRVSAVWSQLDSSGRSRIQAMRSTDGGYTWSNLTDFAAVTFQSSDIFPRILMSDDGQNLAATWTSTGAERNIRFSRSTNGGESWSTPQNLHTTPHNLQSPLRMSASADLTHIRVGFVSFSPANTNVQQLSVIASDNTGANWSTPVAVSSPSGFALNANLVTSANGQTVTAIWGSNTQEVFTSTSTDGGLNWAQPVLIDSNFGANAFEGDSGPRIAASADGSKISAVWGSPIRYSYSTNSGASWSQSAFISNGDFAARQGELLASESGSTFVAVWRQFENGSTTRVRTASLDSPDSEAPVVIGVPDRSANNAGWYNSSVTIDWQATDPEPSSGNATDPADTIASLEGVNTYTSAQSCDPVGNCATGSLQLSIDTQAPTIQFSGNNGTYGVADTIAISCTASDATSQVASSHCPDASGPAYNYLGSNTLNAFAVDNADNTTTSSTTFEVTVTATGIHALIDQIVNSATLANTLKSKANSMENAPNQNACNGMLNGFSGLVNAHVPTNISASNAAVLIAVAEELCQ